MVQAEVRGRADSACDAIFALTRAHEWWAPVASTVCKIRGKSVLARILKTVFNPEIAEEFNSTTETRRHGED